MSLLVDATGLRCPLPVIRLAAAARGAASGTVITVLSTDPAAEPDVAAWCRMRGHELIEQSWLDDATPPADEPEAGEVAAGAIRRLKTLRSQLRIAGAGPGEGPAVPAPAGTGTPPG